MSTAYHPQTDGQTEHVNGVLEDTLWHSAGPFQQDWDELLAPVEFALNNSWPHSIRNTPFMLNYGQNPDDPIVSNLRSLNLNIGQFAGKWSEQLSRAKVCLQAAQDRMKHRWISVGTQPPSFSVGIWCSLTSKTSGCIADCVESLHPVSLDHSRNLWAKPSWPTVWNCRPTSRSVFHVSALKAYKYFSDNYTPPPLPSVIDGHVEYEVDCVTNTKKEGKYRTYLVHWAGYKESTWENVKNLTNCPEKLSEFWAAEGMPFPPRCIIGWYKRQGPLSQMVCSGRRDFPPGSSVMICKLVGS